MRLRAAAVFSLTALWRLLATAPALANGPAPYDTQDAVVTALWCFGSLVAIGAGWALLRRLRERGLGRRDDLERDRAVEDQTVEDRAAEDRAAEDRAGRGPAGRSAATRNPNAPP